MFATINLRRSTQSAAEDDGLTASNAGHPALHDWVATHCQRGPGAICDAVPASGGQHSYGRRAIVCSAAGARSNKLAAARGWPLNLSDGPSDRICHIMFCPLASQLR